MFLSRLVYSMRVPTVNTFLLNVLRSCYPCVYDERMPYSGEERKGLIELGKRLAEARRVAGLTHEQLAIKVLARTGVEIKRSQIQQYEAGTSEPPGTKLDAIAFVLGVEVSELTGRKRLNLLEVAFNDDTLTESEREDAMRDALALVMERRRRRLTNG